jgi:hypothetical protein
VPRAKATAESKTKDPGAIVTAKRQKLAAKIAEKGPPSVFQRGGRLVQVQLLLAESVSEPEIVRWLTTEITPAMVTAAAAEGRALTVKPWKVTPATARDYIKSAWREWQEDERAPLGKVRTLDRQRILHVYRTALKDGNLIVALRAAESVARMNGSFVPQLEAPVGVDMEADEAAEAIEHGYATLLLARRRGALSFKQTANAIDVPAGGDAGDDALEVEVKDALSAAPPVPVVEPPLGSAN